MALTYAPKNTMTQHLSSCSGAQAIVMLQDSHVGTNHGDYLSSLLLDSCVGSSRCTGQKDKAISDDCLKLWRAHLVAADLAFFFALHCTSYDCALSLNTCALD